MKKILVLLLILYLNRSCSERYQESHLEIPYEEYLFDSSRHCYCYGMYIDGPEYFARFAFSGSCFDLRDAEYLSIYSNYIRKINKRRIKQPGKIIVEYPKRLYSTRFSHKILDSTIKIVNCNYRLAYQEDSSILLTPLKK